MKVKDLMRILAECDPELSISSHANNHTYLGDEETRVCLLDSYVGRSVMIGNPSKRNLNAPNWKIIRELDGGNDLPEKWTKYS